MRKIRRPRRRVSMIGRRRAVRDKEGPPRPQRIQVTLVGRNILAGQLAQLAQVIAGSPPPPGRSPHPAGRSAAPAPSIPTREWPCGARANRPPHRWSPAPRCRSARTAPAAETPAFAASARWCRSRHRRSPPTAARADRRARRTHDPATAASAFHETGSSAWQRPATRLWDRPVGTRLAAQLRDPQRLQRHALRVQHAEDVMVRLQQQRRRVGEGLVLRKPARIRVPMRTDDGQVLHRFVQSACDRPGQCPIHRKKPVSIQHAAPSVSLQDHPKTAPL